MLIDSRDTRAFRDNIESKLAELFIRALAEMAKEQSLPLGEDDLNKRLALKMHRINSDANLLPNGSPMREVPNQPETEEDLASEHLDKRPDFTYSFNNQYAVNPQCSRLSFQVECIRLGKPALSREYVKNGISRFVRASHRYGRGVSYGIMVGYVQKREPAAICNEINNALGGLSSECRELAKSLCAFSDESVSRGRQVVRRTEIEPSNFELEHLWADFRSKSATATNSMPFKKSGLAFGKKSSRTT